LEQDLDLDNEERFVRIGMSVPVEGSVMTLIRTA